jgi:hypothetical protein
VKFKEEDEKKEGKIEMTKDKEKN